MTYRTPDVELRGRASRATSTPLGRRIDASGGWWDAGDYLKFVQTPRATRTRCSSPASATSRTDGRRRGSNGSDFTAEAEFGPVAAEDVGRPTRTLYYQVGIGSGNDRTRRRPRHLAAPAGRRHLRRRRSRLPLHPAPAGLPRGAAGLADQPEPRRPAVGGVRARASRCTGRPTRPRRPLPRSPPSTSSTSPTRSPGRLLTAIPYSFYPETEWRDDLELGATELSLALAARRRSAGPAPHARGLLPPARGALGRRVHHRAQRRGRHAQPVRRERARALRAAPGDHGGRARRPGSP